MTTLLGDVEEKGKLQQLSPQQVEELKARVSAQGSAVKDAKTVYPTSASQTPFKSKPTFTMKTNTTHSRWRS